MKSDGINGSGFFFESRLVFAIKAVTMPVRKNAASDPHGSTA